MEGRRAGDLLYSQVRPDKQVIMPLSRLSIALVFGLLGAVYLTWSWSSILGGFGGDNAHYLLMARHFSPYSAASSVATEFAASSFYPPLYPLLLGMTGGGKSLLAAHLITTSFLLAAFALFYWWLRQEGVHLATAGAALLVLATLPGLYFQTLSVHSENLFLLGSIATLAFASRSRQGHSTRWMAFAVVALTAAYFTRSAGIALVAAWLVWLWENRMPQRILFSALAVLPVLAWSLLGKAQSNGYLHQLVGGYHNPAALVDQVATQSLYLFHGWAMNFGVGISAYAVAAILLIIGLTAALWRAKLRQLDGVYVVLYLGMAAVWPFPAEAQRLSLIILPVLLAQSVWMLDRWQLSGREIRPWAWAAFALISVTTLPELALNAQRFASPLPENIPSAYRHAEWWYSPTRETAAENTTAMAALESGMHRLGNFVPENECIYAIKPSIVSYLSGRLAKAPPGAKTAPEEFVREIKAGGCRYVFMIIYNSPSYPTPLYPYQRIPDMLEVVHPVYLSPDRKEDTVVGLLAKIKLPK